jgi:hypothetical protein
MEPSAGKQASKTSAKRALGRAVAIFEGNRPVAAGPVTGRDATMILRDLMLRQNDLRPPDRRVAASLLARPSDGAADPDGWSGPEAPQSPTCAEVCIHWTATGADAPPLADADIDGIPDWVETNLQVAGNVWATEVGDLGYRPPKSDATSVNNGGDARLDIYMANLGRSGLYGYCTSDDPNLLSPAYPFWDFSSFCAFDDDFAPNQFPAHTPIQNLQVTAAHEIFHAVQFSYDTFEDVWLMEGTAAWIEDVIYDAINDNRQYLATSQLRKPSVSLDRGSGTYRYGAWLWWRFLAEYSGPVGAPDNDLIREIWERADGSAGAAFGDAYSLLATRQALAAGGTDFQRAYGDFTLWNRNKAWYEEGRRYPKPSKAPAFGVGRERPSTGWLFARLPHLAVLPVAFVPAGKTKPSSRLKVQVKLPSRKSSPVARALVARRGGILWYRFNLNRRGDGFVRVPFGSAQVKRVEVILGNASSRYRCWRGTNWSCQGSSRDDGWRYWVRASVS